MKKCPNCNKEYRDFDQYCLVCRYKLRYVEGSNKIDYCPEPHESNFAKIPQQSIKPIVTCPYCKSTNTKKISNTSKAMSVGLFGIFGMSKVNKQWHCNNCKSDF